MSKSILVTGATGFVGSHLLDCILAEEPDAVLWGMRRPNSDMRNVRHLDGKVNWVDGDLNDRTSTDSVLLTHAYPDEIYHLGALSWVTPSFEMPAAYMQTNAIGTINFLESMRLLNYKKGDWEDRHARCLVSCTPEEFGDVPEGTVLTEDSPLAPVNPYAASKVAQDAICQTYHAAYAMEIIRTRAFNHEGPRRNANGALASFARQIARIELGLQEPVITVGNLAARRNFTDVRDMVRAYRMAMQEGTPGELYLIGSSEVHTINDCLDSLLQLADTTIRDQIVVESDSSKFRPTELMNLVGDYTKFATLTSWRRRIPFEKTLADILNYWRKREQEDAQWAQS